MPLNWWKFSFSFFSTFTTLLSLTFSDEKKNWVKYERIFAWCEWWWILDSVSFDAKFSIFFYFLGSSVNPLTLFLLDQVTEVSQSMSRKLLKAQISLICFYCKEFLGKLSFQHPCSSTHIQVNSKQRGNKIHIFYSCPSNMFRRNMRANS